ncbi:hypothetical protein HK100_007579, partial [Physocladia obscura]
LYIRGVTIINPGAIKPRIHDGKTTKRAQYHDKNTQKQVNSTMPKKSGAGTGTGFTVSVATAKLFTDEQNKAITKMIQDAISKSKSRTSEEAAETEKKQAEKINNLEYKVEIIERNLADLHKHLVINENTAENNRKDLGHVNLQVDERVQKIEDRLEEVVKAINAINSRLQKKGKYDSKQPKQS